MRPDPATFSPQTGDLYSPPNDLNYWQAAIRTADDPDRSRVEDAMKGTDPLIIDLLYMAIRRAGNGRSADFPSPGMAARMTDGFPLW